MVTLPKFQGTTNKTVKAMIITVQQMLRDIAKPGANRIKRTFTLGDCTVELNQTEMKRFCVTYSSPKLWGHMWLVNNQVEYISIGDSLGTHKGEEVVGRVAPVIEAVKALIHSNTPRGRVKACVEEVREWLFLHTKPSTNTIMRVVGLGDSKYTVRASRCGNFTIEAYGANEDIVLRLKNGELGLSYEKWDSKTLSYKTFPDGKSCDLTCKLLNKLFPKASKEKGIRVH